MKTRLISAVLVWTGLISTRAQLVLPSDISIARCSTTVPAGTAAFSGAWLGAWGGELPAALIVERIDSNGMARVIYSWGDSRTHDFKSGWNREVGQISNGTLRLPSTNGANIDFTLEPGGTLFGRYQLSSYAPPSFAQLHRLSATDVPAIRKAAKKFVVSWKEIRIPVHSQVGPTKGKTLSLQVTVFRQASARKHPVLIFNHGSTGPGLIPASYVFRGGSEEEFFHSLGYSIVVPMRKGRGQSEGPNIEEDQSVSSAVELDSAIEDLHAVIEYLRTQSDVDPRRIVLAGASRGGLLSVAYAGRYPAEVAGVINFSGGWFGEGVPIADFNFEAFGRAGHDAKIPMLWLYADHDRFYSLKFVEREFAKFRDAGGRGELVEVRDLPGEGHMLCLWVDRWRDNVTKYLNSLSANGLR